MKDKESITIDRKQMERLYLQMTHVKNLLLFSESQAELFEAGNLAKAAQKTVRNWLKEGV